MDLSHQNLSELPPEVFKLKNLRTLYLGYNNFTSLPDEIANLKDLESIDLTGNPMSQEEATRIHNLLPKANVLLLTPMDPPYPSP